MVGVGCVVGWALGLGGVGGGRIVGVGRGECVDTFVDDRRYVCCFGGRREVRFCGDWGYGCYFMG